MRLNKKPNDRVAVALVLCFCVVAIASIFTMRSNWEQIDLNKDDNINIAKEDKTPNEGQDVVNPVPTVDSKTPKINSDEKQGTNNQSNNSGETYKTPLEGKITKDFSNDVPIYSATLDQFIIHSGIDIEAPADAQVSAIAAGTVTKVYSDDSLGVTIEISHGNGIVSRYSNLSTTKMVGEGDVVKKGQVISGVGNSALFESLEASHLHFEILKDGVAVNPTIYVKPK